MNNAAARTWRALVPARDVPRDGLGITVEIDGRSLAVFWSEDRPHVIDDECPHRGASLGAGVCLDGDVTCPSHGWHFALASGANTDGLACSVRVYPARESTEGLVEVDLGA